jgi:hypothetical protein
MDSETREVAALRSRWWALAVMSLVAAGLGADTAWAAIQVNIKNCSSMTVQAQAYDAEDSVKLVPYEATSFSPSGGSGSLHCAGQGKGYCQMSLSILNAPAYCNVSASNFHLDSGKWAVVTKVVEQDAASDSKTCTLQIEENLDSAPSSCN